ASGHDLPLHFYAKRTLSPRSHLAQPRTHTSPPSPRIADCAFLHMVYSRISRAMDMLPQFSPGLLKHFLRKRGLSPRSGSPLSQKPKVLELLEIYNGKLIFLLILPRISVQ